jgi:hypothetical protein
MSVLFNLPLSEAVDCQVNDDGSVHFHPWDGKRLPLTLKPEEVQRLLELLYENREMIRSSIEHSREGSNQ